MEANSKRLTPTKKKKITRSYKRTFYNITESIFTWDFTFATNGLNAGASTHIHILQRPCHETSSVRCSYFQKRELISAPVWLGHSMPRYQFQCLSFSLARPRVPSDWETFSAVLRNNCLCIERHRSFQVRWCNQKDQSPRSWRACQLFGSYNHRVQPLLKESGGLSMVPLVSLD